MSLKLLMIPFSILMVFILMIFYVKPDIDVLQEKQLTYTTKLDQAKNVDTLLSNINALKSALDNQGETERFVENYFPKAMDEGRVIDALNYLATQSGVAVVLMNLKEVAMTDAAGNQVSAVPAGVPVDASAAAAETASAPHPKMKAFSARVSVKGRYENIKDFFGRVAHMNRIHKTWNFSLTADDAPVATDPVKAAEEAGVLTGYFEAAFEYFDVVGSQNAQNIPVFEKGTFDMAPYTTTLSWVTNLVPALEKPSAGRPNPFLP